MKIPALDLKAQIRPIRAEINKTIKRVIDNHNFILGEEVKSLEKEISRYCGIKYAIGVSNGTDAIVLTLKALGIKEGDAVICPAFTYYATAAAIVRIGAVPIFADIDSKTYNISIDSIEKILRTTNPSAMLRIRPEQSRGTNYQLRTKIKAIIPVHLYGQCADMDEIMKIAKEYNLKVIEDAAQAFGATYKRKKAGTIADVGTVSFFPAKNLGAFGDAGCVLTDNKTIADKMSILRNQGACNKNKYKHLLLGHNARLDTIQAAVLRVKLKYLDEWNEKRGFNADYYNNKLKNTGLITPYALEHNKHIYHQYVLRTNNKNKEKIVNHLIAKGIDSRTYYPIPLHLQPCFKYLGYKKRDFPESEKCAKESFAIPVYPELTKAQMDYIVEAIKEGLAL